MKQLNKIGKVLGEQSFVHALTDVTGFGLLGHLVEMAEGSGLSAEISYEAVPKIHEVLEYLNPANCPGGTKRNWASYGEKVSMENIDWKLLLADPQTSGGLLVAIAPEARAEFESISQQFDLNLLPIGTVTAQKAKVVYVT
jgi:selenide,water dikinase